MWRETKVFGSRATTVWIFRCRNLSRRGECRAMIAVLQASSQCLDLPRDLTGRQGVINTPGKLGGSRHGAIFGGFGVLRNDDTAMRFELWQGGASIGIHPG